MVGRSKRKIYYSGSGAALLTLPKEWADNLKDKEVHVVFNDFLWVFPNSEIDKVEKLMEKLMTQFLEEEINEKVKTEGDKDVSNS